MSLYYTIPRNNRELQHDGTIKETDIHYTIPRNNRELQPLRHTKLVDAYYTIPRNNRELQQLERAVGQCEIIPYQEIIGNYS